MLRFMIPITLALIATPNSAQEGTKWFVADQSAASESQVKFAIENKYDDTGPGAKQPEYAYNTYKTLEDALVAYLDDPDTQLPEYERDKAIKKLLKTNPSKYQAQDIQRFYPKSVEEYTTSQKTETPNIESKYSFPEHKAPLYYQQKPEFSGYEGNHGSYFKVQKKPTGVFSIPQVRPVTVNPLSLAHSTRDENFNVQLNTRPKYTFSYGVNNKDTGDSKSAHEVREGGTVHGYYSFMDADGKQRVVHYTADDKLGFRATVQRTELGSH